MMRWMKWLGGAGLGLALGLASGASAGGGTVYPGGMCQPVAGLQNDDTVRDHDLVWNGGVNAQFMCPIRNTKVKRTKGLRLVEMRVQPNGGTVSCRLVSASGTSSQSSADVMVTDSVDTTLALSLELSLEGGSYLVRCTLPPGAAIRSYLVVE